MNDPVNFTQLFITTLYHNDLIPLTLCCFLPQNNDDHVNFTQLLPQNIDDPVNFMLLFTQNNEWSR